MTTTPDPADVRLGPPAPAPAPPASPGLRPGGRARPWDPGSTAVVFLDVDGTTLGTEPTASAAVARAHRRAAAAGVGLYFATGRLPRGMRALHHQLAHDAPDVVHNGAAIVHGGKVLQAWPLPGGLADDVARWCLHEGLYAEFYSPAHMYATDHRPEAQIGWDEVSGPPDGAVADVIGSGAVLVKATVNVYDVARVTDVLDMAAQLGLTAELSSAPIMPGVPVVNITARGVTKGAALTWLAGHRLLDLGRALAIGDGWNDVSMFDAVGTAVAMGQAPDGVQARADVVAPPFDDDGLATVLDLLVEHRG